MILAEPDPTGSARRFEAEVIAIRRVIDPVDQTRDWLNAMHWLQSGPMCNPSRIGIWGSSFSGGHVLYVAAHDRRVKAVFSQVGARTRASSWLTTNGRVRRSTRPRTAHAEP